MGALLSHCLKRPLTEDEKKQLDVVGDIVEDVVEDILVQEAKKLSVANDKPNRIQMKIVKNPV